MSVKLRIALIIAILLIGYCCFADDSNLKETLDWLRKTIPQYSIEDRSNDFNRFFDEDTENSRVLSLSFWELSYNENNLCYLTITLKDMRKYEFALTDVVKIIAKQRGEYIKLVVKTERDCVKVERMNDWDAKLESVKEYSKQDSVVIDFPLYAKNAAVQVINAFERAEYPSVMAKKCFNIENSGIRISTIIVEFCLCIQHLHDWIQKNSVYDKA